MGIPNTYHVSAQRLEHARDFQARFAPANLRQHLRGSQCVHF